MVVNEIFYSIDGEGLRTGELAVFIRLAGCNLNCSYCDTKYALKISNGNKMTIAEILEEVGKYNCKNVTLTGGEPLIHAHIKELIDELIKNGYKVNIETNGAVDISEYLNKCLVTMDYKLPSSGMEKFMKLENLEKLTENDVLKFVTEASDFEKLEEILTTYKIKSYIYISPIFGKIEPEEIVNFMKYLNQKGINTEKIRIQVQLHKIIWDPEKRGV